MRMHLIQLLLPLYDKEGRQFSQELFSEVRNTLVDKFGGLTLYRRSPAEGLWEDNHGEINYDEIVIFEVMVRSKREKWWKKYKLELETKFKQDEIMIRASEYWTI